MGLLNAKLVLLRIKFITILNDPESACKQEWEKLNILGVA